MGKFKRFLIKYHKHIMCGAMSGYLEWAFGLKMALAVILSMAIHAIWTR